MLVGKWVEELGNSVWRGRRHATAGSSDSVVATVALESVDMQRLLISEGDRLCRAPCLYEDFNANLQQI
jgi:hypothetical protein